jgi:hypothetical protein
MKPLKPWELVGACGALVALGCGGVTTSDPGPSGPSFVAIGVQGTILSSPDGASWQARASGTSADLRSVAAGRSGFVVVGADGTILTSERGDDWTARRSGADVDLTHVIFTGEQFVAVGGGYDDGAVALTSTDGAAWARVEGPPRHSFQAVALAGSTIVAAAVKPSQTTPMAFDRVVLASIPPSTSNRGGWLELQATSFNDSLILHDEALTVGSYAGQSTLSRSRDGEKWPSQALPSAEARSLANSGETLVVVGGSSVLESPNGTDWTEHGVAPRLLAVAYGAETFTAVGSQGAVMTSPDGANWLEQSAGSRHMLLDVTFGPVP